MISASWTGKSVDWNKLSRALIQYQIMPCRKDGQSSAQKLFGHPVQDSIPTHCRSFALEWQKLAYKEEKAAHSTEDKVQALYNQHAHDLTDLKVGNSVAVQKSLSNLWDIYGTITSIGPHHRYFIKTHSGRVLVQNRRFIRKRLPLSSGAPDNESALQTPEDPSVCLPKEPCRSSRRTCRPDYLLDDPTWLLSSCYHIGARWGSVKTLIRLLSYHVIPRHDHYIITISSRVIG